MYQTLVTYIAQVEAGCVEALRNSLTGAPLPIPFDKIPSLHFSSMIITDEKEERVYFIWENNFDGPRAAYLDLAVRLAETELRGLYKHCVEYKPGEDLRIYLEAHAVEPLAYHIGAPGLSVRRVLAEEELVKQLELRLDELKAAPVRSGDRVQEYLQRRVASDPSLRWAETPEGRLGWLELARRWVSLTFPATLILLAPVLPILAVVLRWKELSEVWEAQGPAKNLKFLLQREDHGVQNHLASVTEVKPGWLRPGILRLVLWVAWFVARVQTRGRLGGIPGIFFAHWSLIDGGKKLLFLSNYSGGWDSYLDDFIDICSWGLTPIWSNTRGFPRTRLLFAGGSRDRSAFKDFVRNSQLESRVWYRAYPDLTVQNVNRNSAIRDGLFRQLTPAKKSQWLRLF